MKKRDRYQVAKGLVPGRTAVLVIDVQRGFFCRKSPPGNARVVLARINQLTAAARRSGAAVALIQHESPPGGELAPRSPEWELHPGIRIGAGDLRVRKKTNDAFYRTTLLSRLRSRGIRTVVLSGYATEFCLQATFCSALSKGFDVVVAADAHTTDDNPVLGAAVIRQHHNWTWANGITERQVSVVPVSEVRFAKA